MKKKITYIISLFIFLLLVASQFFLTSNESGIHNSSCSGCHSSNTNAQGYLGVYNIPETYANNIDYTILVCVKDPSKEGAGFNMVVDRGSFTAGTGTNVNGLSITHSSTLEFLNDSCCWDFIWTAPVTGSAAAEFITYAAAVDGDGKKKGDNGGYSNTITTVVPLPVELTDFQIRLLDQNLVNLKWTTASENNTKYFGVQKSLDGNNWEELEQVVAVGYSNSNNTYTCQDHINNNQPQTNLTIYYRLRIVDFDGYFEYSPIKSIRLKENDFVYQFFPNPARNGIHIQLPEQSEKLQLSIYNLAGQLITKNTIEPETQLFYFEFPDQIDHSGLYIMELKNASESILIRKKLMIQPSY